MKITRVSRITGISHTRDIPATEEQMKLWDDGNGPLIQKVFPNLSADDREFILTGITPEEWAKHFPPEDE
jgi:hypothetical protein